MEIGVFGDVTSCTSEAHGDEGTRQWKFELNGRWDKPEVFKWKKKKTRKRNINNNNNNNSNLRSYRNFDHSYTA